jgi:hypothetical protein
MQQQLPVCEEHLHHPTINQYSGLVFHNLLSLQSKCNRLVRNMYPKHRICSAPRSRLDLRLVMAARKVEAAGVAIYQELHLLLLPEAYPPIRKVILANPTALHPQTRTGAVRVLLLRHKSVLQTKHTIDNILAMKLLGLCHPPHTEVKPPEMEV